MKRPIAHPKQVPAVAAPNSLRLWREHRNIAAQELASQIGVSRAALVTYELKGIGLGREKLRQASKALNVEKWEVDVPPHITIERNPEILVRTP